MSWPVGEIASLGAAACWAVGLTLFRRDVRAIGARQVNLFKGLVGTTLFCVSLLVVGTRPISVDAQLLLALSGVVGLAMGDTFLFRALALLGPHRTALLGLLGPVLTASGAWLLLSEELGPWQIGGVACAVAGVTLVVYAREEDAAARPATARGLVLGVLFAACQATGVLLAKKGLAEADALSATALRLAAATVALALFSLTRRELGPDLHRLFRAAPLARLVPAAAVATFLGLTLMQVGIKHTESAVANALHSTTPLFTLPITLLVLRERVGWLAAAGSFIAVGGVVALLLS